MKNKEKIIKFEDLKKIRGKHQNISFCDGTFNTLNPNDAVFLEQCRNFCDTLVVGIKRDSIIKQLNGNGPTNSEQDRVNLIASMKDVDYVILNEEELYKDTIDNYNIIQELSPNSFIANTEDNNMEDLCNETGIQFIVIS